MRLIFNRVFLQHDINYKENKERLKHFFHLTETPIEFGERYLRYVHTKDYINRIDYC